MKNPEWQHLDNVVCELQSKLLNAKNYDEKYKLITHYHMANHLLAKHSGDAYLRAMFHYRWITEYQNQFFNREDE